MEEKIKVEGFFITPESFEKEFKMAEEHLTHYHQEAIKAFRSGDMKRLSLLTYEDFLKHFSAILISQASITGSCLQRDVEEFLTAVRLDLMGMLKKMGGGLN
jgi:hypothetical protein